MLQARAQARYCVTLKRAPHPDLPVLVGVFPVLAETGTEITVGTNAVAGDDIELRRDAPRFYVTGLAGALGFRADVRQWFADNRRVAPRVSFRPVCRAGPLRRIRPRARARRRRAQTSAAQPARR
jgi:hypothetical protein